jgi:hypothetical protein
VSSTGTTSSQDLSSIYGYPVPDTWVDGQNITADWLNRNVRDTQKFLAYAPVTLVYRNATQSIANAVQATTTFDTEVIDIDNMFTAPSTNLTVQRPGVYAIQSVALWAASTAGAIRSLHIAINGTWVASSNVSPATSSWTSHTTSAIVALDEGDIISQMVFQNSGGALNLGGDAVNRMAVRLLSTANVSLDFDTTTGQGTATGATSGTGTTTSHTPVKHTSTHWAQWSRTYDGDNTTTWDDSRHCYQGRYDSNRGNTKSLIGFDYTAIRSELHGASKITGHFGYKVAHSYYNAGLTTVMGSHKYTSKPSTWADSNVYQNQGQKARCVAGHTYVVPLSAWQCWAWQQGVISGMAFGPGPSTNLVYYGYMYGATEAAKPFVQFTYYK